MLRQAISGTVVAMLILALSTDVAPAAEVNNSILKIIPADAIFCVRVNDINQATAMLDQYLMGIFPMSTSGIIRSQFAMMSAAMPVQMPQMDVRSKSNLALAVKIRNGSAALDIAIPKEHLQEIWRAAYTPQETPTQNTQSEPVMPGGK